MASNRRYLKGRRLPLPVVAGSISGSPVMATNLGGVALVDRDAVTGLATVDKEGVFDMVVTGAVTAVGQAVYYLTNADPDLRLNVDGAGRQFFGYALETKAAPAALCPVLVGEASGISEIAALGVSTAMLADEAVTDAKVLASHNDGLNMLRIARATFDPTGDAGMRTVAVHGLGVTLPAASLILSGMFEVITAFTDAAGASLTALQAEATEDLMADTGVAAMGAGVLLDVVPVGTAATAVKTTIARELSAEVTGAALLGGKGILVVTYVETE